MFIRSTSSMIRRQLFSISTLGGAVEKLFDAVDDLVVTAVEALVQNIKVFQAQ